MKPNRDDQLIADPQALRPTPRPQFAAELDERAAASFPRRSRLPRPSFGRLQAFPPRRLLLSGGGLALLAIATATILVVSNQHSSERPHAVSAVDNPGGATLAAPQYFEGSGKHTEEAAT